MTNAKTINDHEVMERLRAGDEEALTCLLKVHWRGLVHYAYGLVGDWDRAEDVAQNAFVRLWAGRDRWLNRGVVALLYRIARNAALDLIKSSRFTAPDVPVDGLTASASPEADLDRTRLEEAAAQATKALPERRREVFRLAREVGLSYAEIAEVTGLSKQTVANHMSLALRDLRTMLRDVLTEVERGNRGGAADSEPINGLS